MNLELRRDRAKNAIHIFGTLLLLAGGFPLLALLALPFFPNEGRYALAVAVPALAAMVTGALVRLVRPTREHRLTLQQSALLVVGLWVVIPLFTSFTFVLTGFLSFPQALFEALSGWTATGMTMLDVSTTPHVLLLLRSLTQFLGGVGLVLVVVAAMSDSYGMRLYGSEGHTDKLMPNLARSAQTILVLYTSSLAAGTIAYRIAGMPWFDAINHTMTALSTAGFSTQPDSIGHYDSLAIEIITIVLMMIGATPFAAHLLLLGRRLRVFARVGEIRFAVLLVAGLVVLTTVVALAEYYGSFWRGLRFATFNIVSAMTTTGFDTASIVTWPSFAFVALIVVMVMGGHAGSTAGGVKVGRIYLLARMFVWNIGRAFRPERSRNELAMNGPAGKVFVTNELYSKAADYFFGYVTLMTIGTAIVAAHGYSLKYSFFEVTSALGTVGMSTGIASPDAPGGVLWTLMVAMLIGRLEFYVVFVAVVKAARTVGREAKRPFERRYALADGD